MKKFFGFGGKKGLPSSPRNKRVEFTSPYGYHIQEKDLGRIHRAAAMGNVGKVRQILFLGINGVNDTDKMNRTALHLACANGHAEVVTLLAKRKCQLNLVDNENKTALIKEEECASILLDRGADPNVTDADGNTALHHAVLGQNTAIVAKLLAHKANTKAINKDGFTPLLLAVSEKKEHMVEILVKKAAEVEPLERPALHSACANGDIEGVNILAHSKILLNLVDNENKTALIKAVQYQEEECASILLDRGADPNVTDADGNTALHHAVLGQNTAIVAKLLAHKANRRATNKDGLTPLILAISDNNEEMVVFLVRETVHIKQLESNHQQTSVYKTEGRPESLSESSKSLVVDKKSEEDPLSSLSSKSNIDDSWPTSEDEDFDFDTKKATNPHLAKLLAGFPQFPKTGEATKPAIGKKGNGKISALREHENTDSPWDLESVSASVPQNYVVYLPEAEDQRGKNILNGQVEDSPEKICSSKAAVEVKDPLSKKAVGMISDQTSRSDSTEEICSSKAAVKVKDPLPKKALRMNSEQTSSSDSPDVFSFSQPRVKRKFPVLKNAVGMNSVQTSRFDSPEKISFSKAAVEVKDPLPKKGVRMTSVETSSSDSTEKICSSKAAVEVKDPLHKKALRMNSKQTSSSDSTEKICSSKAAVEVKDPLHKKALRMNSEQTSSSDSLEVFSFSQPRVKQKVPVLKNAVGMNSVPTSRSDSTEKICSSKAVADVKDPLPEKAVRTTSAQTSRSDSPETYILLKHTVEVKDPVPERPVRENSVQTSRSANRDLQVASGEEEERLDGSENNHPQVSHSYEKGKSLLHEKHMLQAEIAKLRLEIDTIKNQNQEMEEKYFEDIVTVKENNDLLQKTIKMNEKTFQKTISRYNGQLNVLTAKNTILKSKLETEKKDKERLETEIESYRSRLATAVQDHETSEGGLQRDFQRARDEWFRLRDKMSCDMSDLKDRNEILSQQLSEAENKFNNLEIELHHTRDALRERTLVLEGVQRDLSQTQCQKKETEHMYQKEQDKVNKYLEKQGSLEERLSQLQSENELLRQQLDDAHSEVYKREKTVIDFKDQLQDIMKVFQTRSEKHALMLNEKYMKLINICNRLKEGMHECENSKAEKDATVRPLQQELAGTLKNQSMSEASLQTTSHSHVNLEDEALDIKKKLDQSRSQNDDLTAKLVTVSSKCLNLDEKNKCLRQELVSTKPLQKKYETLKNKNRNLKQEVVNLKRHTPANTTELSEGAQCRRKAEERARRDIEAKSEVSRFSQRQAASQENLEKLKEIHYALVIRQLEFKSNHLESELTKIKTSHDSKETDLEKYRQLYLKEIESKQSLRDELNKTKDRLAEANTELLLQKWQNESSLSTFNPKPDPETPYDGNFDNFSLNRNPTQRDKLAISVSKTWTSPDVKQESEKKSNQRTKRRCC